ncbi:MAG TPA: hypothetical protein VEF71_25640 [Streptosporangiaceae bacterium]|nr:hypothetical protein [Streptosporangiaceae bacterium]
MTARTRNQDQDIMLTSEGTELIRGALVACSQLLRWAERYYGAALAEATRAAEGGRTPGQLRYDVCLAIDYLDFAPAIRSRR